MKVRRAALGLAALVAVAACRPDATVADAARAPTTLQSVAGVEQFAVDSRQFELRQSTSCLLVTPGPADTALTLALNPPCQVMRWGVAPPARPAESGGQPLGTSGDPMAWRYPVAGGTVIWFITGSATADKTVAPPARPGCFDGAQAVLLRQGGISIGKPLSGGRSYCTVDGLDEKNFWLAAYR